MMQPVFRFAPSPNGFLHLGHAYSALLNARLARAAGGRFLVRIEDIDSLRCTPDKVAACMEDLAWLGLEWERPVLMQSSQFGRYRAVAAGLEARGLLYPCTCSRGDIARDAGENPVRDPEGAIHYPGTCRALSEEARAALKASGRPYALRLDMQKANALVGELAWQEAEWQEAEWQEAEDATLARYGPQPANTAAWGDVVLVRKDCPTSYHLAVVQDDAMQGVTHVVRGRDLFAATGIHRVLQVLLGLPEPRYFHHALVMDDAGNKLAKSSVSTPLRALRAQGVTPAALRTRFGFKA